MTYIKYNNNICYYYLYILNVMFCGIISINIVLTKYSSYIYTLSPLSTPDNSQLIAFSIK